MGDNESQNGNKGNGKGKNGADFNKIIALVIIFILVSIAIYNYDFTLGYDSSSEGSFIGRAFYLIKALIGGLFNVISNTLSSISSEFWSILLVLVVFLGLAYFISKD